MKNPPNVGKYTIYMDGMGTVDGNQNFGECSPVEGQVVEVPLLFFDIPGGSGFRWNSSINSSTV